MSERTSFALRLAGHHLAVAEQAFIWLQSIMPHANALPASNAEIPILLPGLPRCSEHAISRGGPCRNPATAPFGLCIGHFLPLFGHASTWTPSFNQQWATRTCRACGISWRSTNGETPTHLIHQLKAEDRAAIRTICSARTLSPRACEIASREATHA